VHPTTSPASTAISSSRVALAGFLVAGVLLSFPGAILPAWGYHIRPHYTSIGNYFLALNAGLLAAFQVALRILPARGIGVTAILGCTAAFASLVGLSLTAPPTAEIWRVPGFFGLGFAAGLLNTAIFHALSPAYRQEPAATINLAGLFFGFGSLLVSLMIAGTFNIYTVSSILFFVAIIPGMAAISFAKRRFPPEATRGRQRTVGEVAREFTIPSAVLFSLLLFFQFGNEWTIAGWLPLFLIQRLGMSPSVALMMLALYWFALIVGRLVAQTLLPRVHHGKMLLAAVSAALLGCLVLTFTNNRFGAILGTLLVGIGFAPVYPLVVEKIGARFPHYHPGFLNGIFSVALTGGMLAPATVGYACQFFGIGVVMIVPVAGTFIVFLLVLAIWLEARFGGSDLAKPQHNRL
jgi:fucose permease